MTTDGRGSPAAERRPLPLRVAAAAGAALALWSGTAVANKIAVGHMDATTAGILRSLLAGAVALAIAAGCRLPLPRRGRDRVLLLVAGLASFAVWPMLLSLGLGATTAGHAALIMALIPVFTGLIAAAFEGRAPRGGWWLGAALALAGTALLLAARGADAESPRAASLAGDLVVLSGAAACALGYVAGGRVSRAIGTWATTFWGLGAAAPFLLPVFLALAGGTDWRAVGTEGWLAVGYLAVMSSLVGYAAWFWALGRGGIARIGAWQFAQPVLTLVIAVPMLGEVPTVLLVASAALILVGTTIAQHRAGG